MINQVPCSGRSASGPSCATNLVARLRHLTGAILLLFAASARALDPALPPSGNFDLTHWYLTLPDDSATAIKPAVLSSGYTHPTWFYTGADGSMVFWCPVDGGTTSGATYPRAELRENIQPGVNNVNWTVFGTHTLDAQCKVLQIPSNGRVVIGQIHSYLGNAYELIVLNYISGDIFAQLRISPNGTTKTNFLIAKVPLNQPITYQIKVIDGLLLVTVNGTPFLANLLALDPAWADNTFYFKAGSYVHDNTGDSDEGSRVAFYSLNASHGGPPSITRQPADLLVRTNAPATFDADALGEAPLTFQWLRDGLPIPHATNRSHTIPAATTNDLAAYQFTARNNSGSVTSRLATLTLTDVSPPPTLGTSVDYTAVPWSTAGHLPFTGQRDISHDGTDAAASSPIAHSQTSTIKTTVTGPGTLGYWWRASTEPANDRFLFYIGTSEKARISGETGWQWKTHSISSGAQALTWTYSKNSSKTGGLDRVWLDEVQYIPTAARVAPAIIIQPLATNADTGTRVTLAVTAFGSSTLKYQWRHNGTNLSNDSTAGISGATSATLALSAITPARAGDYTVVVTNTAGAVTSAPAALTITLVPTLAEALDQPGLTWTTSSSYGWSGQTNRTHDGTDAARSGPLPHDKSTYIQTKVTGPGTLNFHWRVSCQTNDDRLRFYLNGTEQARISGEVDWQPRTYLLPAGSHTLKWSYSKDDELTAGEDRAWVDEIRYTPGASLIAFAPAPQPVGVPVTITRAGTGIHLTWPHEPGRAYHIQATSDLAAPDWPPLPLPITITGPTATAHDPAPANPRYYRILPY